MVITTELTVVLVSALIGLVSTIFGIYILYKATRPHVRVLNIDPKNAAKEPELLRNDFSRVEHLPPAREPIEKYYADPTIVKESLGIDNKSHPDIEGKTSPPHNSPHLGEIALLSRRVDNIEREIDRRVDLIEKEIDRRDSINKWLIALLLTLSLGFVTLAASVAYKTIAP